MIMRIIERRLRRLYKSQFALGTLAAFVSATPAVSAAPSFDEVVPTVFTHNDILRVNSSREVPQDHNGSRAFTFNSHLNVPAGSGYVIVTDCDAEALASLNRLAQFRSAQIIKLRDLRNLARMPEARNFLLRRLRETNPAYVAFAPRVESFSENTLLSFWQILLSYGEGKLTVYPGLLVGRNAEDLDSLISRSIANKSFTVDKLNPVVISQAAGQSEGGLRAVKKAAVIEEIFQGLGQPCPGLVVRAPGAVPQVFPKIGSLGTIAVTGGGPLKSVPPNAVDALGQARMIVLFGHGSPGMSCSVGVQAFDGIAMPNDIVLCGSCFSSTPVVSDLMTKSNGQRPDSLVFHSLRNGASVFFGHMHENSGFPQLFVAFESLMKGESVGQSYQRVLNCLFADCRVPAQNFILTDDELADPDGKAVNARNNLMFVMVGDPAAVPISAAK